MATIWDALRVDTLLQLLGTTESFNGHPKNDDGGYAGIGTFVDCSYGHSYIDKHFDSVKGSLALFGDYSLVAERAAEGAILVGIQSGGTNVAPTFVTDPTALSDGLCSRLKEMITSTSDTIDLEKVLESYLRAAKEAFRAANGLATEGSKLASGMPIMPTVPQADGISAAETLRMMLAMKAMEGPDAAEGPKIAPSTATLEQAIDSISLHSLGFSVPPLPSDPTAFAATLYDSLLALSGLIGKTLSDLAKAKAETDGATVNASQLAMLKDSNAFFASIISHQRRYLSNPGALGPRVAFPLSVYDQCVGYQSIHAAGTISREFAALRTKVEFGHLVSDKITEEVDQGFSPPPTYYTTLRVL